LNNLADIEIKSIPVMKELPLKYVNEILQNNSSLVMVGFDLLQVPILRIIFQLK